MTDTNDIKAVVENSIDAVNKLHTDVVEGLKRLLEQTEGHRIILYDPDDEDSAPTTAVVYARHDVVETTIEAIRLEGDNLLIDTDYIEGLDIADICNSWSVLVDLAYGLLIFEK